MNECATPRKPHRHLARRLLLLVLSLAAGVVVGAIGYHFTARQAWFLAIPGAVALVWLFVANPEECGATQQRSSDPSQRR